MEKRLVIRLMGYWERLRNGDPLPDFKKNNPAMIEDLWTQCFVLSIAPPRGAVYKYEYLGDKVKDVYGGDISGRSFELQNRQFPNSIIARRLQEMVKTGTKTPQEDSGHTPSADGKLIKYRIVLLPFGNEKSGLTHIIVGISFREF